MNILLNIIPVLIQILGLILCKLLNPNIHYYTSIIGSFMYINIFVFPIYLTIVNCISLVKFRTSMLIGYLVVCAIIFLCQFISQLTISLSFGEPMGFSILYLLIAIGITTIAWWIMCAIVMHFRYK